jgi:hypothetical protein
MGSFVRERKHVRLKLFSFAAAAAVEIPPSRAGVHVD